MFCVQAQKVSDDLMQKIGSKNRRALDLVAAKCYYYHARVYEFLQQLHIIRRYQGSEEEEEWVRGRRRSRFERGGGVGSEEEEWVRGRRSRFGGGGVRVGSEEQEEALVQKRRRRRGFLFFLP